MNICHTWKPVKVETKYNLRPHPLPVPRVNHAFAKSCLLYKLVKIKKRTCNIS